MNISVRKARLEDSSVICNAEKIWASRPGFLVSRPFELEEVAFSKKIQNLSENSRGLYVVAQTDTNEVVGHALLDPMGLEALSHIVRLTIVVHPGFEEKGIGSVLMSYLISWAKGAGGVEKIELLVRATNKHAVTLYKKFGFAEEGRIRNRIKISDGSYIDDLTMGLLLKNP